MTEYFDIHKRRYEKLTFAEAALRVHKFTDKGDTIIKLELETTGVWHLIWKDKHDYQHSISSTLRSAVINFVAPVL